MRATVLITGFGPFPGAPFNPTEPLALALACRRHPAFHDVRRIAHIFPVSYEAIDRDFPALLKRERPEALIMFGLATRTRHLRVETRARNALASTLPDIGGNRPNAMMIAPGASGGCCGQHEPPACRPRCPAMPAAISAITCAGAPPKRRAPACRAW